MRVMEYLLKGDGKGHFEYMPQLNRDYQLKVVQEILSG